MMLTGRVPERIGKDGIVHDREAVDAIASSGPITELMESESEAIRDAAAETYLRNRALDQRSSHQRFRWRDGQRATREG